MFHSLNILNLVLNRRLTSEEHAVLSHTHNDLQQLVFQRHFSPSWTLLLRQIRKYKLNIFAVFWFCILIVYSDCVFCILIVYSAFWLCIRIVYSDCVFWILIVYSVLLLHMNHCPNPHGPRPNHTVRLVKTVKRKFSLYSVILYSDSIF